MIKKKEKLYICMFVKLSIENARLLWKGQGRERSGMTKQVVHKEACKYSYVFYYHYIT